jgi:hypothetical protein
MHGCIVGEQRAATIRATDRQLAVDRVVASDLSATEQTVEWVRVWRATGQEANPD